MARFTSDTVERVKQAADIVEIVSAHTDLRRQGQRFTGLCPFHDERTPSFSVNPAEKLYYCFGCEAGGDVIRFVQEKEGLDFAGAVEALAERYGVEIELEQEDPRAEQARKRRARLHEALERTASFYAAFLWDSPQAERARSYLTSRGLEEQVLRDFGVGFAPSAWDTVLMRGQQAGFTVEEMLGAGLVQRGRDGGNYDRFRRRIVFPIRDARGRALGFGARALDPDTKPKYVNSPEGELYRKSETLFGVDRARAAIARAGRAIVVEGYTDVLALHQAGIEEAVAVMGTAITPEQLGALSGLTDTVVLGLDADRAGRDAMLRAQRVAGKRRLRLLVLSMPAGTDPCDFLQQQPVERFAELVEAAVELPEFHVRTILDAAELGSGAGRDRALAEVAPVLGAIERSAMRDELTRLVADRLSLDPALVGQQVERAGARAAEHPVGRSAVPAEPPAVLAPHERRERALLAMCAAEPKQGAAYLDRLTPEHLSSPLAARALEWLRANLEAPMSGLPRDDEELTELITQIVMLAEREPASVEAIELSFIELELRRVERLLAGEQQKGDSTSPDVLRLQRERSELSERLRRGVAV